VARPIKVKFVEEGLDDLKKGADNWADEMKGLGAKAAAGFGAAWVAAKVGEQISQALNIDAGVDKLQARLGLTSREAGKLGKLAGDTYSNAWGESLEEVQGFYSATMKAFPDLTDKALKKVTESAATTADVWDQDFNEIVRVAQQLLTNGLAPDAKTAMDQVATALQKTKGPTDEVIQALDEYSNHFAQVGLDGSNILGALTSKWATNQYAIDKVGDAVKELGIRTLDGSELTKEGLKAIGLNVGEVEAAFAKGGETAGKMTKRIIEGILGIEDPAERARAGVALMGTPFEDLGKNAVPILKDVVEGQKELTDTVKVGNKAYDNAQTKIETWRRKGLMKLTEYVGGTVIPVIEEDLIPAFEDFFATLDVGRKKHIPDHADAVTKFIGVRVPEGVDEGSDAWRRYRRILNQQLDDGVGDVADFHRLVSNKTLTWGEKFGIIWRDIWAENTKTEQRNLNRMTGIGDAFQAAQRGDWRTFGGALKRVWSGVWPDMAAASSSGMATIRTRMIAGLDRIRRNVINPLISLWNRVSKPFGGPTLSPLGRTSGGNTTGARSTRDQEFAEGGKVGGQGMGDTVRAWLTPGEFVLSRKAVDRIGVATLEKLNRWGREPPTGGDPARRYADGGWVWAPKYAAGGPIAVANFARQYDGNSYRWGGVGPNFDCSGWVSALLNVWEGKPPFFRRRFTTSSISAGNGVVAGLAPRRGNFNIGSYVGNPGHMAATVDGTNAEAGGGHGTSAWGPPADGAFDSRFNRKWHASGSAFDFAAMIRKAIDRIIDRIGGDSFMDRLGRAMARTASTAMLDRVGSFAEGTPYVSRGGLARVHRGESIIPAGGITVQVFIGDDEVIDKKVNVIIDRREDREDTRLRMGGGR
jgi:hypothetical protein